MRTCDGCGASFPYDRRSPRRTRCGDCRTDGTAARDALLSRLLADVGVEQAAAEVGLHPDSVRRMIRSGRIAAAALPPPAAARAWRDEAACRTAGIDAEMWYAPEGSGHGGGDAYRDARRICSVCPVKAECLDEGHRVDAAWHSGGVGHGLWGGFSPAERARMRATPTVRRLTGDALYRAAVSERYDLARLAEETA